MKTNTLAAVAAIALAVFSSSCVNASDERSYVDARSASDAEALPFSGAVRIGDTLYLSGALGLADGKVPDDPAEEARLVMDSIRETVENAGMTMDDIVSVQVFCSDVSHYQAFNEVYRTYFTREFPARAFIGSGTLLFNARFEVQGIAVKRSD
ncbi:MAG: RidA family protein [Gammaproteobacteria bacterium]|nr:RidA family protein [Gammaproteobacteria bacterium]